MGRIKFKNSGEQKAFLDTVIAHMQAPSLRGLLPFGITTNYTALKNYYTERRCLPEALFYELCDLANIQSTSFDYVLLADVWGQSKGGKKSKRKSLKVST